MEYYEKFNPREKDSQTLERIKAKRESAKEEGLCYCPSCTYYLGTPNFKGFKVACRRYDEFMNSMGRLIVEDTNRCDSYKESKEIELALQEKSKEPKRKTPAL